MSKGKRECYTGPATLDGVRILRMRGGQVYDRSSVLEVGERPAGRDAEAFKVHHLSGRRLQRMENEAGWRTR